MKKLIILPLFLAVIFSLSAQQSVTNYDESKVPVYTLPDPLIFNDGSRVRNKKGWDKRSLEIIKIFENEVYGISPEWKGKLFSSEISVNQNALNGISMRKEIKLTLKNGKKQLDMIILLYLPRSSK